MGIVLAGSEVVILARISIDLLANSFNGIAASGLLLTISDHLFSWGGDSEGSAKAAAVGAKPAFLQQSAG